MIFAELGATGVWDERQEISLFKEKKFAFVITHNDKSDPIFAMRYNPATIAAMEEAYPHVSEQAGLKIRTPSEAP